MKHLSLINEFREELTSLSREIETSSLMGHFDINKVCEDLVCGLFRELFGLAQLRNLNNEEKQNFPGIDLADDQARIAIQVTSTINLGKIKDSITTFLKYKFNDKYDRLIVFILTKKQPSYSQSNAAIVRRNGHSNLFTGRYFSCKDGNPIYKMPTFSKEGYKTGSSTVTGQAFLTQKGGGVVTCAGNPVEMHPNTEYFNQLFNDVANGYTTIEKLSQDEKNLLKTSQCDAQGNFEFYKVPSGKWVITVNVSWDVNFVRNNGFFYYVDTSKQGGYQTKEVNVQEGEVNKFIISQ